MLEARALPRAPPSTCRRGSGRGRRALPLGAAAVARCAARARGRRRASTTRAASAPRSAACCAARRASTCATSPVPRLRRRAPRPPARAAAPRRSRSTRRSGRRPHDGRVTLFALLELYKPGEATWTQAEPFGDIAIRRATPRGRRRRRVLAQLTELARIVEALLFLGPTRSAPRSRRGGRTGRRRARRGARRAALEYAPGARGLQSARRRRDPRDRPGGRGRRAAAARQAAHAAADAGAGRDARDRRLPPTGLAPGDRPHPRRQRRLGDRRRSSSAG